jgi:hypothetical protein
MAFAAGVAALCGLAAGGIGRLLLKNTAVKNPRFSASLITALLGAIAGFFDQHDPRVHRSFPRLLTKNGYWIALHPIPINNKWLVLSKHPDEVVILTSFAQHQELSFNRIFHRDVLRDIAHPLVVQVSAPFLDQATCFTLRANQPAE